MKRAAAVALIVAVAISPAAAHDTRASGLERQRAENAKSLHPYEPSRIERILFEFVTLDVQTVHSEYATWRERVRIYFRRVKDDWQAVGLDRLP